MQKTPHYWAVVLTHERITYGQILEENPDLLYTVKRAIFKAAQEVFEQARVEGIDAPQPPQQEQQEGQ